MTIAFELSDVPTRAQEKDITKNPYYPMISALIESGKAAKFTLPTEEGDDFKKATTRCRTRLNEISDHIKRTIRAKFSEEGNTYRAEVWVMDRKIERTKKGETPTETPADATAETPTETPADTPADTPTDAAEETPVAEGKANRRNRTRR